MKTHPAKSRLNPLLISTPSCLALGLPLSAATINVNSGNFDAFIANASNTANTADIIDPASEALNITPSLRGGTDETTLEALDNYQVIQSFDGISGTTNTFVFDDSAYAAFPDVTITQTGGTANGATTSTGLITSLDSGLGWRGTPSFIISFSEDVLAASFTLANPKNTTPTAIFKDSEGNVLTTILPGTSNGSNGQTFFVGYDAPDDNIRTIEITMSRNNSGNASLDDIGFQIVPEPASAVLIAFGGLLLTTRRRSDR